MIENGQPDGGYLLKYGGCEIPFRLSLGDRKKLTIHVYPEMRVEVLAPRGRDVESILARVQGRARWIVKQWRYFDQFHPKQPERRFVSGETHRYLGRQYRLKILTGDWPSEAVKLIGPYFCVHVQSDQDGQSVETLLEDWYRARAKEVFGRRVRVCLDSSMSLKVAVPVVQVRTMARRWGSCTQRGTILLNLELIKAPVACIDYVVMHELCHLKEPNHGPRFFRLLSRFMPDWEVRKERLESLVI